MIDLINKLNIESKNDLLNKYQSIIPFIGNKKEEEIFQILYIINVGVNYIQTKHENESADWKSWIILLLKKLFEQNLIKTIDNIHQYIDEFLNYKNVEYNNYLSDIVLFSEEYYRDLPFINKYIKTINK